MTDVTDAIAEIASTQETPAEPVEPAEGAEGAEELSDTTREAMSKLRHENASRRHDNKDLKEKNSDLQGRLHELGNFAKLQGDNAAAVHDFAGMLADGHNEQAAAWMEQNLAVLRGQPAVGNEQALTPAAGLPATSQELDKMLDDRIAARLGEHSSAQDQKLAAADRIEKIRVVVEAQAIKLGYTVNDKERAFAQYRVLLQYAADEPRDLPVADQIANAHKLLVDSGVAPPAQEATQAQVAANSTQSGTGAGAPPVGEAPSGQRPEGTAAERALARVNRKMSVP